MIALHNCEDGSVGGELWDNEAMKTRDAERHPGPWRVMRIESGLIGIIVAIGFLLMGFVSMPVAMWFLLGAFVLVGGIALLLRFSRKE